MQGRTRLPRKYRGKRGSACGPARGTGGFTLIEILIVISIIALLSSLVLVAVNRARSGTAAAIAGTEVSSLSSALEQYYQDEGEYPGLSEKMTADTNLFPKLYDALFGEHRPQGPGGRNAPYMKIKEDKVAVWDRDSETYITASRDQRLNPKVKKYLLDPWGNVYVYRPNKGRKQEAYMHNLYGADIYSLGQNGMDDTAEENDESDDIGNW
ncbi:MAG: prepilin-type N-terminal cleavage/methylation domain-containing protein [Planctomycetes bacterium]|nr:prepilin-type N-terminal cleavage/methylation domain-containing protein [Planctomycetota bacterium]